MCKEGIHIPALYLAVRRYLSTLWEGHIQKSVWPFNQLHHWSTYLAITVPGNELTTEDRIPESLFSDVPLLSQPLHTIPLVPGIQGVWWRVDCIAVGEKLYPSQVKCGMMWCPGCLTSLCRTSSESTGNPEALDGAVLGTFLHRHTQHRQGETSQNLFPKTQS